MLRVCRPDETRTTVLRKIFCGANDSLEVSGLRGPRPIIFSAVTSKCSLKSLSISLKVRSEPSAHHHGKLSPNRLRGDHPRASSARSALTANHAILRNPSLLSPSHPTSEMPCESHTVPSEPTSNVQPCTGLPQGERRSLRSNQY